MLFVIEIFLRVKKVKQSFFLFLECVLLFIKVNYLKMFKRESGNGNLLLGLFIFKIMRMQYSLFKVF